MYSLLDIFRESYILNEHGISDVETELQVCMLFQMRLMLDFKLVNLEQNTNKFSTTMFIIILCFFTLFISNNCISTHMNLYVDIQEITCILTRIRACIIIEQSSYSHGCRSVLTIQPSLCMHNGHQNQKAPGDRKKVAFERARSLQDCVTSPQSDHQCSPYATQPRYGGLVV